MIIFGKKTEMEMIWLAINDKNKAINDLKREELQIKFATTCANIMRAKNINYNHQDNNFPDHPDSQRGTTDKISDLIDHLMQAPLSEGCKAIKSLTI